MADPMKIRAQMKVHERARLFYAHYGFQPSPLDAMTLMLRLKS